MRDLSGWVPTRIEWASGHPEVDWGHVGGRRYSEPFFSQTIEQCVRHPADVLFRHRTTMEELGEWAGRSPSVPATGFIFHMSRCGSTLVSQMLAALPQNVVLSEAGPVDDVLRAHFANPRVTDEQRVEWLQWIIAGLGQCRNPGEKHLFIKFDCWHVMLLPLIRRAFPHVPWIFLYRDPLEVMASAKKQLGGQMIPGVLQPELFGWERGAVEAMPLYEYAARVLAKFCEAAHEHAKVGDGKLVNYTQLPSILSPELETFWKLDLSAAEREKMFGAAQLDAKNPVLPFEPDSQAKRESLPPELRSLTREWLGDVYARLESLRKAAGFAQEP